MLYLLLKYTLWKNIFMLRSTVLYIYRFLTADNFNGRMEEFVQLHDIHQRQIKTKYWKATKVETKKENVIDWTITDL